MKRLAFWLSYWALAAALSAPALAGASKPKPADDDQAQGDASADADAQASDKRRLEQYLKARIAKVQQAHEKRMEFFDKQQDAWQRFWNKIRDDRQRFSIDLTRQTLDLFSSLSSLDPKDHAATIANFEKLQTDELRAFDQKERQMMQDFFAGREVGWRDFAAQQDQERSQFIADAAAGWQQQKAAMAAAFDRQVPSSRGAKPSH